MGQVRLATGEIAEDVTAYYAISEQIPTVCALGVLVDRENHQAMLSGGLLIQVLPGADNAAIDRLEANVRTLEPVTTMLANGMTMEEICARALDGFEMEILDEYQVKYVCTCSREKVVQAFSTMKKDELLSLRMKQAMRKLPASTAERSTVSLWKSWKRSQKRLPKKNKKI